MHRRGFDRVDKTSHRFRWSCPNGETWEPNSPVTMALAAKHGRPKKMGNHPLVASGILMDTISYMVDGKSLYVDTDRFADDWNGGAAVLQFGTDRAGRGNKVTIPARPFLGISDSDAREIEETVHDYLSRLIDGR
ncbi:MAG: phage virion morphogenesis protein [Candidatus Accumulibacter sp.]|nr:phage virion morphogenesis protein [Accumulibacter sp.]